MSNITHRCSRLLAALAALALASGCQVALSTLSKRTGWANESSQPNEPPREEPTVAEAAPPPEPHRTELPAPAPEPAPAYEVTRAPEPERTAMRPTSTKPEQPTFVSLSVGERAPAGAIASCRAPGRGEMCGGVCTDVQVSNDHCGMCGNDCNPGSHCDFSTCRNAEGKPE